MTDYSPWSDSALRAQQQGTNKGAARAAGYLLTIPEEFRERANSDGTIQANMSGLRYADGVDAAVARVQAGNTSFWYIGENRRIIEQERTARDAHLAALGREYRNGNEAHSAAHGPTEQQL